MSELNENSRQLTMEEYASPQIDKSFAVTNEPMEITTNKITCSKSNGDGCGIVEFLHSGLLDVSDIDMASLCSVDKMRIDRLISELNKCRDSKKEIELELLVSKSENKAIQNAFESCKSRQENDKTDLKSKLSTETRELKELTTDTSYSLDILADQISAWELETSLIRDTIDELLDNKIHLQKEMNTMETRMLLLTAEDSRIKDTSEMKKLQFIKNKLKEDIMIMLTSDRSCQTEAITLE